MVMTFGGTTIADTLGGSISNQIGGDGGFVFSNNVCGTPSNTWACGSYGTWSVTTSTYGYGANSGHIASRTFVASLAQSSLPWLARYPQNGEVAVPGTPNVYKHHAGRRWRCRPSAPAARRTFI